FSCFFWFLAVSAQKTVSGPHRYYSQWHISAVAKAVLQAHAMTGNTQAWFCVKHSRLSRAVAPLTRLPDSNRLRNCRRFEQLPISTPFHKESSEPPWQTMYPR